MKKQAKGPKFRVGQVVAPRSENLVEWVGRYFIVVAVKADSRDRFIYMTDPKGPWLGEEAVRPLTVRETGPARGRKA